MATLLNGCELQVASGTITNGGVPADGCISLSADNQSGFHSPNAYISTAQPASPQPLVTTKDSTGKTLTAIGKVPIKEATIVFGK